jgi:membrane protein implicated in regulation of membrane protease activity
MTMTRTRIVFFAVLGIFLSIVAASIAMQLIGELLLRQFFIAGTVFAVGVVLLDFLGIFGGDQSGDAAGAEGGGDGDVGDAAGDGNGSDANGGDSLESADSNPDMVLSVLTYLRLAVYFSLGFGPMGLAALLTGRSPLVALAIAVPVGVVALFLAQAFFRFQQSHTDSTVQGNELLMQQATVTVPLTHTTMGRIRLQIGMSIVEQFALAEDPDTEYRRGDAVRVVRVTEDCVYVR